MHLERNLKSHELRPGNICYCLYEEEIFLILKVRLYSSDAMIQYISADGRTSIMFSSNTTQFNRIKTSP